jgi:glycerol-3-phosphate dehydrogenase
MITFSPEQDQYLQIAQRKAYFQGLKDGITRFAWWKDGTQYVGTTGKTLTEALDEIDAEEKESADMMLRWVNIWD